MRQLEARAEDLKAAATGHKGRARDSAAEVAKGNRIIEKLTVRSLPAAARPGASTDIKPHWKLLQ